VTAPAGYPGAPHPGAPYPGAPYPGAPAPRKPRALLIAGPLLMVVGIALGITAGVVGVRAVERATDDLQRVGPAGGPVHLDAGVHRIYAEYPDAGRYDRGYQVRVRGEVRELEIRHSVGTHTYVYGDREGREIGRVDVRRPGTYRIEPVGEAPDEGYAVGDPSLRGLLGAVGFGVAGGFAFLLGLILLIVGIVLRVSRRTPLVPFGGPRPPGAWGGGASSGTWGPRPPGDGPVFLDSDLPPPPPPTTTAPPPPPPHAEPWGGTGTGTGDAGAGDRPQGPIS